MPTRSRVAAKAVIAPMVLSIMLLCACAGASTSADDVDRSADVSAAADCPTSAGVPEVGIASYYADSLDGNTTASGEVYDKTALSAAHKSLAFGTTVCVTNLENGRFVVVRVNDRGPFVAGRIIDLSRAAASKIGLIQSGITRVRMTVVSSP